MFNTDVSRASPVEDFQARINKIGNGKFTPATLAWRCRCGCLMASTTKPGTEHINDTVTNLVDAARTHHSNGCRT